MFLQGKFRLGSCNSNFAETEQVQLRGEQGIFDVNSCHTYFVKQQNPIPQGISMQIRIIHILLSNN